MKNNRAIFNNVEDLKEWLLNVREKYYVELKKAQELQMHFGKHTLLFATLPAE